MTPEQYREMIPQALRDLSFALDSARIDGQIRASQHPRCTSCGSADTYPHDAGTTSEQWFTCLSCGTVFK